MEGRDQKGLWLAVAGVASVGLGVLVGAAGYDGGTYRPWNHFVSELGWQRYSENAMVFNWALVLAGALLGLGCLLAARQLPRWRALVGGLGLTTSLAVSWVGLSPMDDLPSHLVAALGFFWSLLGFTVVYLVSQWQFRRQRPVGYGLGIATNVLALLLLAYPKEGLLKALGNWAEFERPAIWPLAAIEWLLVISASAWLITFCLQRANVPFDPVDCR